jgi:hypothetical protein
MNNTAIGGEIFENIVSANWITCGKCSYSDKTSEIAAAERQGQDLLQILID